MGRLTDWINKPQRTNNQNLMDDLVHNFEETKEKQHIKDKEGADREMAKEEMIESAELVEEINEQIQEIENKEYDLEQEGQYEEVEVGPDPEEERSPEQVVERGFVIFQDANGTMRHQHIGQLSLSDITYYSRYLTEIEKGLWAKEMAGEKNA